MATKSRVTFSNFSPGNITITVSQLNMAMWGASPLTLTPGNSITEFFSPNSGSSNSGFELQFLNSNGEFAEVVFTMNDGDPPQVDVNYNPAFVNIWISPPTTDLPFYSVYINVGTFINAPSFINSLIQANVSAIEAAIPQNVILSYKTHTFNFTDVSGLNTLNNSFLSFSTPSQLPVLNGSYYFNALFNSNSSIGLSGYIDGHSTLANISVAFENLQVFIQGTVTLTSGPQSGQITATPQITLFQCNMDTYSVSSIDLIALIGIISAICPEVGLAVALTALIIELIEEPSTTDLLQAVNSTYNQAIITNINSSLPSITFSA